VDPVNGVLVSLPRSVVHGEQKQREESTSSKYSIKPPMIEIKLYVSTQHISPLSLIRRERHLLFDLLPTLEMAKKKFIKLARKSRMEITTSIPMNTEETYLIINSTPYAQINE
jgi:hypothetical protein